LNRLCVAVPGGDKAQTSPTLVGGRPIGSKISRSRVGRWAPGGAGSDHFPVLRQLEINVIARMGAMIGIQVLHATESRLAMPAVTP
jgi:hypothetical protein